MTTHCPKCKTPATKDVNFCTKCGANLRGAAEALQSGASSERFDWSKTWLADMLLTEDERTRRRVASEIPSRPEDLVAAELRQAAELQKEIKNGIITASAGIGVIFFLLVFMGAIAGMQGDPKTAMMLRSLWTAGLIPLLVGVGMLVNAFFVSKHFSRHRQNLLRSVFAPDAPAFGERPRITGELPALAAPPSAVPSVTEHTTRQLVEPEPVLRAKARTE